MKEHKNPKVLSEGISWMFSAVEDFGVPHLKLKVISNCFLPYVLLSLLLWYYLHCNASYNIREISNNTGFD